MNQFKFYLVFIFGFAIYFYFDANFFSILQKKITLIIQSRAMGHILAYSITLIPLLIIVQFLKKRNESIFKSLGLSSNFFWGLMMAFFSTLPMLIAYIIRFKLHAIQFDTVVINTISSPFFEEIIYRAFLFGMLYKYTKLGFLPSVFLGSFLFGIIHLYQAQNFTESAGVFAITFLGSIFFSWIYAEWKFNLWTAISLHFLMNLYWLLFNVDEIVIGGIYANIFRFLTIAIAIFITVFLKKKHKDPFEITKKTIWWKSIDKYP